MNTLHQLSRQLVNDYDLLVHENLPIPNLVRRAKPATRPPRAAMRRTGPRPSAR